MPKRQHWNRTLELQLLFPKYTVYSFSVAAKVYSRLVHSMPADLFEIDLHLHTDDKRCSCMYAGVDIN